MFCTNGWLEFLYSSYKFDPYSILTVVDELYPKPPYKVADTPQMPRGTGTVTVYWHIILSCMPLGDLP